MGVRRGLCAVMVAVIATVLVGSGFSQPPADRVTVTGSAAAAEDRFTACLTPDGRLIEVDVEPASPPASPPVYVSSAELVAEAVPAVESSPGTSTSPSLTVTSGDGGLFAQWEPVDGSVWHQWRYREVGTPGWALAFAKNTFEAELSGLNNGTTYDVEVRAYVGGSYRNWTRVQATPGAMSEPEPDGDDGDTGDGGDESGEDCRPVSWGGMVDGPGVVVPWTLYHAATFRLTSEGCPPLHHRWVAHETWGESLEWIPSACWYYSTAGAVPYTHRLLGLASGLPTDRTLFQTEVLPVFGGGTSGPICSGLQVYGVLCSLFHYDFGGFRDLVESEPVSPPVVIWQIPTSWMPPPPLSAPMSPPVATP